MTSPRSTANTANRQARQTALDAVAALPAFAGTGVDYQSRGRVLIIGPVARALPVLAKLGETSHRTLLLPRGESVPVTLPDDAHAFAAELVRLEGYLGRFKVIVLAGERESELADLEGGEGYDIVLDLGGKPAVRAELPPPGYFAPADDLALDEALAAIREMTGEFEKPRYVRVDPDLCAHSASGLIGCTRCVDVCPAWAIKPDGEKITVDVHLCHGVGSCASACPTGAISYNYPDRRTLLGRLRTLLHGYVAAGGAHPRVLIHDEAADTSGALAADLPDGLLPFAVEEIGVAGLDLWLSALAYGAHEVLVLVDEATSRSVRDVLSRELATAQAIADGLDLPAEAVRTITASEIDVPAGSSSVPQRPAATFAPLGDKREAIRMATDHLFDVMENPRDNVELPAGGPFGEVQVNDRCTLCMSCASVCPTQALIAGNDRPTLNFIEAHCVQCGLCVEACPEEAVTLRPRYLLDAGRRWQSVLLREDEAVCCTDCGKAFAPRSTIERLRERLTGHRMFAGAAMRRLELCEECRVKEIMRETGEA